MAGCRTILHRHCPGIGIGVRQGYRAMVVARPIVTVLTLLTLFWLVKLVWLAPVFLFVSSCLVRHGHSLTLRFGVTGAGQGRCSRQPLHG